LQQQRRQPGHLPVTCSRALILQTGFGRFKTPKAPISGEGNRGENQEPPSAVAVAEKGARGQIGMVKELLTEGSGPCAHPALWHVPNKKIL